MPGTHNAAEGMSEHNVGIFMILGGANFNGKAAVKKLWASHLQNLRQFLPAALNVSAVAAASHHDWVWRFRSNVSPQTD